MRKVNVYITMLIVLAVGGCSQVQVSQDFRAGVDFSRYNPSYQWRSGEQPASEDPRLSNPLLHERFREAIDRELAADGLQVRPDATLEVSYSYTIRTQVESDHFGTSIGVGFGRHTHYGGIGFGTVGDIRQYDIGMLVIDISERGTGSLLWRGSGSEIVTHHASPEQTTAFVNRMVGAIMRQFPPSP